MLSCPAPGADRAGVRVREAHAPRRHDHGDLVMGVWRARSEAAPSAAAARPRPARTRDITAFGGTDRANRPPKRPKVVISRHGHGSGSGGTARRPDCPDARQAASARQRGEIPACHVHVRDDSAEALTAVPPVAVEGNCDRRFEPVREALLGNFRDRGERGGAVCVLVDGRVVADLCGGWADPGCTRRWQPDTLVNMFSVGKGLLAVCAARLAGQGRLDLDAPVAACWPEFGAAGKGAITVRQLLSHQAGLPAVRRRLPPGSMLDWPVMASALAAQEPWWEPGTGDGYHVNTFGYLAGEVIRRVTGATVGTLLREEVAGPLGADVHIGLPASQDARVAEFSWPGPP